MVLRLGADRRRVRGRAAAVRPGPALQRGLPVAAGLRAGRLRLIRDQALARLGASLVALAISGVAVAWMVGARCRVW